MSLGSALARRAAACARVAVAGAGIAIVVLGVTALPASAHSTAGLPSTDWRSRVVEVRVGRTADPALRAATSNLGQHLRLTVAPGSDVTVLGYSGEPYLWFTHGRVLENMRSPAVWLNRRKSASPTEKAPKPYSATATPLWEAVTAGTSYRWHDQRVHAFSSDSHSFNWTVPLLVNGQNGAIAGRLDLVAGPPLALYLLTIVLAPVAVFFIARRRPPAMAALALVVAGMAALQLTGTWQATTADLLQRIGPSAYAVGAVIAGVAIALTVALGSERRYPEILLLGGVVLAITGGLAHIDWLTHSQLPSVWNAGVARVFLIAQLVTGLGAAAAGVTLLEARVKAADAEREAANAAPATTTTTLSPTA
ncbi:MAG TPA: hypothetical protein VGI86_06490 [Acidimicrobiia bacterium]